MDMDPEEKKRVRVPNGAECDVIRNWIEFKFKYQYMDTDP